MDYTADTLNNLTFPSPIASISLVDVGDGEIHIAFMDGSRLTLKDDGQSCCEVRHISTDCTLTDYVGATIRNIRIEDGPSTEDSYGNCHDTQFLKIDTTDGTIDFVTHNEHNGYYGGFSIVATFKEK